MVSAHLYALHQEPIALSELFHKLISAYLVKILGWHLISMRACSTQLLVYMFGFHFVSLFIGF